MGHLIPILIVVSILFLIYFLIQNSKKKATSSKQEATLFQDLEKQGYARKDASHCIRFTKDLGEGIRIEIEWSLMNKKEPRLDIDVYKDGFSINLPEDVTPAFFEFVVFQNYNNMLQDTRGIELLSDQGGDYFQRSTFKKLPTVTELQEQLDAHVDLYQNFPYHEASDADQALFEALIQDGYQSHRGPQQMVFRFSKAIDKDHLSLYYVKAMDMLFLACSPLSDAAIQEDFRDDQTLLHHFNKEPALVTEGADSRFVFPTLEEFKAVEAELLGLEAESSEEEE